ncbi:hypothetical protein AeNC1_007770, partial [Aphanomyces euteiches]
NVPLQLPRAIFDFSPDTADQDQDAPTNPDFVFSIHTRQIDAVVDFRDCLEDFNMDGIGAFLRTNKDEPVPVEKALLRWCLMSKVDYGINLNMKMHAIYRQGAWGSMRDAQLLCLVEYDLIE